jgi:hypothetical protein
LAQAPARKRNDMGAEPRKYFELTLACVAGCAPRTFRGWRGNNGLFAGENDLGERGVYSVADISVARCVVLLTGLGLSAQISVDAAMKARRIFEKLFTDEAVDSSLTNIIAIYPTGRSEHFAYPRLANENAADGACVIVDAITIMGHVLDELDALKPPTIMIANAERLALEAMAEAWRPRALAPNDAPLSVHDRCRKWLLATWGDDGISPDLGDAVRILGSVPT